VISYKTNMYFFNDIRVSAYAAEPVFCDCYFLSNSTKKKQKNKMEHRIQKVLWQYLNRNLCRDVLTLENPCSLLLVPLAYHMTCCEHEVKLLFRYKGALCKLGNRELCVFEITSKFIDPVSVAVSSNYTKANVRETGSALCSPSRRVIVYLMISVHFKLRDWEPPNTFQDAFEHTLPWGM
jgi:hypothetical protein